VRGGNDRERTVEVDGLLDRRPVRRALGLVTRNALAHLLVAGLARCDEGDRRALRPRALDGERRLAAARPADVDDESQKSIPRRARIPLSYACRTFTISVTVSATWTSSSGALRPVATTFTRAGRERIAVATSAESIQP